MWDSGLYAFGGPTSTVHGSESEGHCRHEKTLQVVELSIFSVSNVVLPANPKLAVLPTGSKPVLMPSFSHDAPDKSCASSGYLSKILEVGSSDPKLSFWTYVLLICVTPPQGPMVRGIAKGVIIRARRASHFLGTTHAASPNQIGCS